MQQVAQPLPPQTQQPLLLLATVAGLCCCSRHFLVHQCCRQYPNRKAGAHTQVSLLSSIVDSASPHMAGRTWCTKTASEEPQTCKVAAHPLSMAQLGAAPMSHPMGVPRVMSHDDMTNSECPPLSQAQIQKTAEAVSTSEPFDTLVLCKTRILRCALTASCSKSKNCIGPGYAVAGTAA